MIEISLYCNSFGIEKEFWLNFQKRFEEVFSISHKDEEKRYQKGPFPKNYE